MRLPILPQLRTSGGVPAVRQSLLAVAAAAVLLAPAHLSADMLTLISPNEAAQGFFGTSVSGIPDIDGDGIDDFMVGAPGENAFGLSSSGRVYVYSGVTG